jgi:hypothetical protein
MQTLSTTPNITSAFDWTHSSLHLPLVFFFFFFPFDTSVDVVTQSGRSTFSVSPWRRSIFSFSLSFILESRVITTSYSAAGRVRVAKQREGSAVVIERWDLFFPFFSVLVLTQPAKRKWA